MQTKWEPTDMGLLDGMEPNAGRKYTCKVQTLAEGLEPADAAIYWDAIDNDEWSAHDLERQLIERGMSITQNTITRHRRKACACSKA